MNDSAKNAEKPRSVASERCRLPREKRAARHGGVVGHPDQRQLVDRRQRLQRANRESPDRRLPPQHVPPPQHEEQADADAADDIEQHHADDRTDADGFVRRAHAVVAPRERLGNPDEVRDFRQPIAGDDQAQPVAPLAERRLSSARR